VNEMLRLDDRVAVVTGAGRGIGRSEALLLASRGAKVVVNDLGSAVDGSPEPGETPAEDVAGEIRAAGGEAIANTADITDPDQANSIVDQAIEAFGRVDIVVNNAGILFPMRTILEADLASFQKMWLVHVGGTINVVRAAWPHMMRQEYGRIINTGAGAAYFGMGPFSEYSSAKAAVHGLTKSLALQGAEHGIAVNIVVPSGVTRMHESSNKAFDGSGGIEQIPDHVLEANRVEFVAPLFVWLAHEACRVSGEAFGAFGGHVGRFMVGETEGFWDLELSAESIRENWDQIMDSELQLYTGSVRDFVKAVLTRRPNTASVE
jgi:NAD(P)-dependent dehydrogenase (short-subunit alcohol dehydrogenase family)